MPFLHKIIKSLLCPLLLVAATGFFWNGTILAQDAPVWKLEKKKELILIGSGIIGSGAGLWMQSNAVALSPEALTALNPSRVPVYDRWSLDRYNSTAKKGSDLLLYGGTLVPGALLLLDPAIRRAPQKPVLIMAQALSLNAGMVLITKHLTLRNRPYAYNPAVPLVDKLDKDARASFFSGHSATMATISFGYAGIWSAYHPDSAWKPVVWASAAALPAAMGLLRVQAGKHFLSDVLVGYAVGATCGYLLPRLHRVKRN